MALDPLRRGVFLLLLACCTRCASEAPTERDADADGDGRSGAADCNDASAAHWDDCDTCVDNDGDDHGEGCNLPDCDDSTTTGVYCSSDCFMARRDADNDGRSAIGGEIVHICAFTSGYSSLEALDDCDDTDKRHWADCGVCADPDDDGFGPGCDYGEDCDQASPNVWSSCATCRDVDHDGAYVGCDAYTTFAEDCDERDPLIHPGAVDFPDNALAEDCVSFSEPNATSGDGVYVSSDCGSSELGTISAPFCTLTAALAASPAGASVFVAAGQYAMPDTMSSVRIFGGYLPGWFLRSSSRTATSFTSATAPTGVILDDVLIQNATYFYTNDCDNCSALTIGDGGARLADFDVAVENTATDCASIQATGEAVLVRVKLFGASCVRHRALVQSDRAIVVWKSELQAGSPGSVTQQPTVIWGAGPLRVGETTLSADGQRATGIQTFSGAVVELRSVRVSVEAYDDISAGIAHAGSSLRVMNSLIEATSTPGTAFPLAISSGTADIFHTNIAGVGTGATAVQVSTTGPVRLINDVLAAEGSLGSYGINIPVAGAEVAVLTNDFQVSGPGTTCVLLREGVCGDPIGVDGNIQATGCELASSTSCTRIGAGTALDAELLPRVDLDYAPRLGWDIGAYELPRSP